ncbi:phosphate uptake regulator PhoU [Halorussus aquaticus]|uniref:PhoU domain-containing protein n=1 Tax=Halorussus aquaticus TaxID=2953748 RepID=A0ABD5Q969_9EURY|nr:phosphate uptake regulator PhoU [Halorussus aquaticus]
MEARKVQKVGGGTYTVSMPVDWADEHDIEAGDLLYLYPHLDGSLTIRRNEKDQSELSNVEIVLTDSEVSTAKRMFQAAYTAGFDKITLYPEDIFTRKQRQAVISLSRELTGIEVAEESESQITVQGLLDASEVSIRQSVIQLRFNTLSMHEAAIAAFAGDATEVEYISRRDDEADRVFQLITRHFNRSLKDFDELNQLGLSRRELFAYYFTARQLERVADHAVKIANVASRYDGEIDEELRSEVRSLGSDSRQIVEDSTDAVINDYSAGEIHSTLNFCNRVTEDVSVIDEALVDRTPKEAFVVTRVLDSIDRTAKYGKNIAECALQNSLWS